MLDQATGCRRRRRAEWIGMLETKGGEKERIVDKVTRSEEFIDHSNDDSPF